MEKYMWEVLRQLESEMPFDEAKEVYEWYCSTYRVGGSSICPDSVRYEVFGF